MPPQLPFQSFLALAAIGWADGSLPRVEREALVRAARDCGIEGDELVLIEQASVEKRELKRLDLAGLSSWEQVVTYALASWFATRRGFVSTREHETLAHIGDRLSLPEHVRIRAQAASHDIAGTRGEGNPERYDFVRLAARLKERLPQLAGADP